MKRISTLPTRRGWRTDAGRWLFVPSREETDMKGAVLGLDVGGANLKAAHTYGAARSLPFALWKDPGRLAAALHPLLADGRAAARLAVTMTGELGDCFESKRDGVAAILDAVEEAAGGLPLRVFTVEGRFLDAASARRSPLQVAAANW